MFVSGGPNRHKVWGTLGFTVGRRHRRRSTARPPFLCALVPQEFVNLATRAVNIGLHAGLPAVPKWHAMLEMASRTVCLFTRSRLC